MTHLRDLNAACVFHVGWLLALSAVNIAHAADTYTPRTGDIVFHTSTSSQSRAVQEATGSRYSHMGVVLRHQGQWQVFEAVQPAELPAERP